MAESMPSSNGFALIANIEMMPLRKIICRKFSAIIAEEFLIFSSRIKAVIDPR